MATKTTKETSPETTEEVVEIKLTPAEKAELEASLEKAKQDIMDNRTKDVELFKQHKELWQDRYECKITCVSRKGETSHGVTVGHPDNPHKTHRVSVRLGVWIREDDGGLPMFIIQKFQRAFDTESQEQIVSGVKPDQMGTTHRIIKKPRFSVEIGKKCDPAKRIPTAVKLERLGITRKDD